MVKRLIVSLLPIVALYSAPLWPASQQLTEKHYRQAAWQFYLQQPAIALETLQLAPQHDARTRLLEAGLYLQLEMPQHAATILEQLLADNSVSDNALPASLRNIALLQFARYQLEVGNKAAAKAYLSQVSMTQDQRYIGQQQLLTQLINWPDIDIPPAPEFDLLGQEAEMPYIISNQALALSKRQPELAQEWLKQLSKRLGTGHEQGFWQQLFSGIWLPYVPPKGFDYPLAEHVALADYIQLTQAQLYIEQNELAAADAILSQFGRDSVLSNSALELYRQILTEQRHIPTLLAVLQQQIKQQPFSLTAWQAATRIGEQFERALQQHDALAAYRWADDYYQQQQSAIVQQAQPLQVSQLPSKLSRWQQLQISSDSGLNRLQQDILALQHQLNDAPQRQQRLARLLQVVSYKLTQQQQLLSEQLPSLTARRQQLAEQFDNLQLHIANDLAQPMALFLWQGQGYQQLATVQRARQRLEQLQQAPQINTTTQAKRLAKLDAILQWQFNYDRADRRWQLKKQQQQLAAQLAVLDGKLQQLQQQGNSTAQLQQQQQQLQQLTLQQQQLNMSLLSKQQQLLAQLNQHLQQLRQQQFVQLQQLQRHNKEALARVMEREIMQPSTASSGSEP